MYRVFVYLSIVWLMLSCKEDCKSSPGALAVIESKGMEIPVYDFEGFQPLLQKNDGKIRIVNFWATWCKPCVAELPYFELINSRYSKEEVEVILVSLDLPNHVETKLIPFLKRNELQSKVILLDDPDANSWISEVDKNWSGAIPATIIYKNNMSTFYEQSFTYNELEKELKKIL